MSDQDRDRLLLDEDEDSGDVEAHVLGGRGQYSERDEPAGREREQHATVEAHKLA